ncbi:MAG: AAA family ATPase [Myxacorys californica WJT36-NPBG1]|jgi:5-methylcytosine-specific restriction endonuclease McrBC GTP-binding regulatory subunit McrB|nr:AAA family ATPase [Myxacorys californica WJT36-NPBG1]
MVPDVIPLQKVLFGSPGTGKSYQIREIATAQLGIALDETTKTLANTVKTVFHPEYTYADFMGKLLPQSQGGSIIYKFYPGHFLQALGSAYQGLMNGNREHYLLVIDELNRGNAAAIFGTVFQLLDRESDYWSSYEIDLSDLELMELFKLMSYEPTLNNQVITIKYKPYQDFFNDQEQAALSNFNLDGARLARLLKRGKISIPPNLSILATINTSDESIYYLDSAFKRRWDWEYVESPTLMSVAPDSIQSIRLVLDNGSDLKWRNCIVGVNRFILSNAQSIRRIEDKQIGWWFMKSDDGKISLQQVKGKLMFYLWDNVFAKDRRPLEIILTKKLARTNPVKLITFADFVEHTEVLMRYFQLEGEDF